MANKHDPQRRQSGAQICQEGETDTVQPRTQGNIPDTFQGYFYHYHFNHSQILISEKSLPDIETLMRLSSTLPTFFKAQLLALVFLVKVYGTLEHLFGTHEGISFKMVGGRMLIFKLMSC